MLNDSLNRREACRRLTAGMAATVLGGRALHAASEEADFRLNYILGSCMYGTTKVEEILPEVKKIGAQHIDLWPRVHGNQREQVEKMGHDRFMALLKENGVKLGMTTRYDLGPYKLQDEMKAVNKMGGRLIVTGARNADGKTLRDRVKAFVKNLEPHVAEAEKQGITIGIENHGHALINTPDSIRYFGEFAKSPHLGIALAPYHLPQKEDLLAGLIEDLGPSLVHFYAWEHGMGCHKKRPKKQEMMQMPGYGELDFKPLVAALKKIDYRGWTEIFMHPVPRGIPILEPTSRVTAAINRSRDYLGQCLKELKKST